MSITKRQVEVISTIRRYRYASEEQLARKLFTHLKYPLKELSKHLPPLVKAGYVKAIESKVYYVPDAGIRKLVTPSLGLELSEFPPTPRGKPSGAKLNHSLRITEFLVELELEAEKHGCRIFFDFEFMEFNGLNLIPDATVTLMDDKGRCLLFYLEVDMGTEKEEDIEDKAFRYRKLGEIAGDANPAFDRFIKCLAPKFRLKCRPAVADFGFGVLFVCPDSRRVDTLKPITQGDERFRFSTFASPVLEGLFGAPSPITQGSEP